MHETIVSLITETSYGKLEILPNHARAIISTSNTVNVITDSFGNKKYISTSKGILYINDNLIVICCDNADLVDNIKGWLIQSFFILPFVY